MNRKKGWKKSQNPRLDGGGRRKRSQYKGTQNRERKRSIMVTEHWCVQWGQLGAHGALGSPRGTKTQGNAGPQAIPFGPLGSQMEPGKIHRERRETLLISSAQLLPPHHTEAQHGTRTLNWLLCIFKSSSCIS